MKPPLRAEELRFRDGNINILNHAGWQNEYFRIYFLPLTKMLSENRFFAICFLINSAEVFCVKWENLLCLQCIIFC